MPVAIGIAGAWLALLLAGRADYTVGPFRVELFARPGRGVTEIALPPFGQLRADTHFSPLRLSVTLEEVAATELTDLVRHKGVDDLALEAEEEGLAALRRYIWRALIIGTAGAGVAGLLVYRRRLRRAGAAALSGFVLLAGSTGLSSLTYQPEAFLRPTFSGTLALAPRLVGPIQEATGRIDDFRAELERLVGGAVEAYAQIAGTPPASSGALTLLHVSDMHISPLGMDFAQRLASSFEADLVVDTGDLTSFGTPLEQGITARIEEFSVPYVFVRGNHDSVLTVEEVTAEPNGLVLDHESREILGLRLFGAPSPVFTPTMERARDEEAFAETIRSVGEVVASEVRSAFPPPDLLLVHDDRMAEAAAGLVPVVLSGHFHDTGAREMDGTLFLRVGTTGGGGLDTFTTSESIPLSAQILYFDGEPLRLVAWDAVELDPVTQDLTLSRSLASDLLDAQEPAPEQEPAPTP